MGSRQTNLKANRQNGDVTVQHNETDVPLIPIDQLEKLSRFKPDAVDWVLSQTQIEGEFRRDETKRVNTLTFIERVLGQVFALVIGAGGVLAGSYVAVNGQPTAGMSIAGAAIGSLAVAFLIGRNKRR